MEKRPPRISGVDYKPPGSDSWQRHESAEVRRALRQQARRLLREADEKIRRVRRLSLRRREDLLVFERDMAAALGAWDRWVRAGARRLLHQGREVAEVAAHDAWAAVRKAFKIESDE